MGAVPAQGPIATAMDIAGSLEIGPRRCALFLLVGEACSRHADNATPLYNLLTTEAVCTGLPVNSMPESARPALGALQAPLSCPTRRDLQIPCQW